ncbi:unnamed protein product [Camellia sinensis]
MGKEHAFVVSNHKSDVDWLAGWLLAQVGLCGFLSIYFLKEAGLRMKNFKGTHFTQAKLEAAQEYTASAGLPVPRNVLIPRTKMHVHLKLHLMKDLPETDDAVAQWCRDMFVAKDPIF